MVLYEKSILELVVSSLMVMVISYMKFCIRVYVATASDMSLIITNRRKWDRRCAIYKAKNLGLMSKVGQHKDLRGQASCCFFCI